jgi:hypothetical protein
VTTHGAVTPDGRVTGEPVARHSWLFLVNAV